MLRAWCIKMELSWVSLTMCSCTNSRVTISYYYSSNLWYCGLFQFILCIRKGGETVYQKVLTGEKGKHLKSWEWGFPHQNATYHALYPRAWTVYNIPEFNLRLTCRQISPIFPHDYKVSRAIIGILQNYYPLFNISFMDFSQFFEISDWHLVAKRYYEELQIEFWLFAEFFLLVFQTFLSCSLSIRLKLNCSVKPM